MLCLSLSWIYDGSFDPSELPSRTAALIVFQCGLMDVGLKIKEINPLRFCLIFKRRLTFLSGVSLSWMSARERTALLWRLWLVPGARARARAGLRVRARVIFRIESSSCFNNRKNTLKMSGVHTLTYTHTDALSREEFAALALFHVRPRLPSI